MPGSSTPPPDPRGKRPWGLSWRGSPWFITSVVTLGIAVDLCSYSIVVPILPFRLSSLGYADDRLSSLVSYTLLSYSLGLVVATPPIAYFSARVTGRKNPLILGLLVLIASQLMFMFVEPFWALCVARVIQGGASAVVWVLALVLVCESVPEEIIGQQLGIAMAGTSIGLACGPPLGGVLYERLGWHAPIIFSIIVAVFDLIGRLLILETSTVKLWADEKPSETISAPIIDSDRTLPPSTLSVWELLKALLGSPRGLTAYGMTFVYGFIYSSMEPTLTLRLRDVWGKNALEVGVIYIAAIVPTFFGSPLAGWMSDRYGTETTVFPLLLFSIPWYLLLILKQSLAGFIAYLAISSGVLAMIVAPISADLAAVAQSTPGVGYTHVYGSFNIAFSVASAVGTLVGGQLYDHLSNGLGWTVCCILWAALSLLSIPPSIAFVGERPLLRRWLDRGKPASEEEEEAKVEEGHSAEEHDLEEEEKTVGVEGGERVGGDEKGMVGREREQEAERTTIELDKLGVREEGKPI